MARKNTTNSARKRVWAWLAPLEHSRLKIMAARRGDYMEEIVREAILEKLDRAERAPCKSS